MTYKPEAEHNLANHETRALKLHLDSERMLRVADYMDGEAEMIIGGRGFRLMRSQARALRTLAELSAKVGDGVKVREG